MRLEGRLRMTAARRRVSEYLLDGLAQSGAPPASAGVREITPGMVRLAVPAPWRTPDGFASLGDVLVQVGEASVLRKHVVVGQDDPRTEPGPDPIDDAEKPDLTWLGALICLLSATSTSTAIVWALVG
jgi:hypothetical protein